MKASDFQIHQYKSGHQLIESSIVLDRQDQDVIDRLSDISGSLRPNETFAPYFTCYPLPGETHFVIARTWQDLGAPRSGCVFTRSFLLPMDQWTNAQNVENYFSDLLYYKPPIQTHESNLINLKIPENAYSDFVFELVEALFLEERRPIVVFNSSNELNVVIKLYNGLWASMRRNFSICTLALSPRTIGSKYLDLQFSTTNSRAKFADWNGRKIEAVKNTVIAPRHRWTTIIAESIFGGSSLSLKDNPNLNFNYFEVLGDESALRFALLWQELKSKAETVPTAILGLLDIANSQSTISQKLVSALDPTIYLVLNSVKESFDPLSAWQFYLAFLGKFSNLHIDLPLLKTIKKHTDALSSKHPKKALEFLQTYNNANQEISPILFSSIANGIAERRKMIDDISLLSSVAAKYGLHLAAASSSFASLLSDIWNQDKEVQNGLRYIVADVGKKILDRSFINLSETIYDDDDIVLLNFLSDFSDNQFERRLLHAVCVNTCFERKIINTWLIEKLTKKNNHRILLNELEANWTAKSDKQFLSDILINEPALLSSFVKVTNVSVNDKKHAINRLWDSNEALNRKSIHIDEQLIVAILDIILPVDETNVNLVINLLVCSDVSTDVALDIVERYVKIPVPENCFGLYKLVSNGFSSASKRYYPQISNLLRFVSVSHFDTIFSSATSPKLSSQRCLDNLDILLEQQQRFCNGLVYNVEFISNILGKSNINLVPESLLKNWSNLIHSASMHFTKQNNAAIIALKFAYIHPIPKTSHILVVAFPIVYKSLKNGKPYAWISYLFFKDLDKCRKLREDLVLRYLNSRWPPSGLFIIAIRSGFLGELLNILTRKKKGIVFVRAAEKEMKGMYKNKEISLILNEFRRH